MHHLFKLLDYLNIKSCTKIQFSENSLNPNIHFIMLRVKSTCVYLLFSVEKENQIGTDQVWTNRVRLLTSQIVEIMFVT